MESQPFVSNHLPCPCGVSSDAFSLRADGSGLCFSGHCGGKNFSAFDLNKTNKGVEVIEDTENIIEETQSKPQQPNQSFETKFYGHRGLSEATCRFYDIKTKFIDSEPFEVLFKYPEFTKIRQWSDKKFRSVGNAKDPDLFGMDKFDPGSKDSITITAGEYDAPSLFQATSGKSACVSLPSGAKSQALKVLTKHRDYVNSFKKIYLALDNDIPDQETTKAISSLFDFTKVYIVKFNRHKDANDYLQHDEGYDLFRVWDGARRYSPDNIISQFSDIREALNDESEELLGTYPFETINNMTYGIHAGEVILVYAVGYDQNQDSSGVGKTEFFRACEHHLLKTTKHNIGIVHLEEGRKTTIKAIAGYELNLPAVLPDSGLSNEDVFEGYQKALGYDDSRAHIFSSFDTQDENTFIDNIRFLGAGANCRIVFIDHMQWLATGLETSDTTAKLDRYMQRLELLARELNIAIVLISHVNDLGQTRGSRTISFVSKTHIKIKRNKLAVDPVTRNTVFFELPKVRLGGQTGPAGCAIMDPVTRKLSEPKLTDEYRIPL